MNTITITITSKSLGEILTTSALGRTHGQSLNFKCPECRHCLSVEVSIEPRTKMIVFKEPDDEPEETRNTIENVMVKSDLDYYEDSSYLEPTEHDWSELEEPEGDFIAPDGTALEDTEDYNPLSEAESLKVASTKERQKVVFVESEVVSGMEETYLEGESLEQEKDRKSSSAKSKRQKKPHYNNAKPWECMVCHNTYLEKRNLNRHQVDSIECMEEIKKRSWTHEAQVGHCIFCDESFYDTKPLTEHMALVHSYRRFQVKCSKCGKVFGSDAEKRQHMMKRHLEKTGKRFQCRYCPMQFVRKYTCKTHEKTHSQYVPIELIVDEHEEHLVVEEDYIEDAVRLED